MKSHLARSLLLLGILASCTKQRDAEMHPDSDRALHDSATMAAIAQATARLKEHGNVGFSIEDVKRTRDWFTPQLYDLLVRGMSDDAPGPGYLNFDPFTDAQDNVGPFRFEDVRQSGDSVLVRFSREGYALKRDSVTFVMRRVGDSWRIADFIYSAHTACHKDLAIALTRYAQNIAAKRSPNEGCRD